MKSKKGLWAFVLVVVLVAAGWFYLHGEVIAPEHTQTSTSTPVGAKTLRDVSVNIDGHILQLVNGEVQAPVAPGSASMSTTRYFGNEATGDLNGDGAEDTAFLITHDEGGSGTFYYVLVGLKTDAGYLTTNAVLLGDRIAPQTTEIHTDATGPVVVVNYADRKPNEPMTASPSVGVSRTFHVVHGGLEEIKK